MNVWEIRVVGPYTPLNDDSRMITRYHQICEHCGQDFLHQRIDRICYQCSGVQVDHV